MVKYGSVTAAHINAALEKEVLIIEITDDGIPFSFKDNLAKPDASGLKNINSRLHAVNAVIAQEEHDKGNRFVITLKNVNNA